MWTEQRIVVILQRPVRQGPVVDTSTGTGTPHRPGSLAASPPTVDGGLQTLLADPPLWVHNRTRELT